MPAYDDAKGVLYGIDMQKPLVRSFLNKVPIRCTVYMRMKPYALLLMGCRDHFILFLQMTIHVSGQLIREPDGVPGKSILYSGGDGFRYKICEQDALPGEHQFLRVRGDIALADKVPDKVWYQVEIVEPEFVHELGFFVGEQANSAEEQLFYDHVLIGHLVSPVHRYRIIPYLVGILLDVIQVLIIQISYFPEGRSSVSYHVLVSPGVFDIPALTTVPGKGKGAP